MPQGGASIDAGRASAGAVDLTSPMPPQPHQPVIPTQ